MIINGKSLLEAAPIIDMIDEKRQSDGVSHGLSEAGYDIRLKQDISFYPPSGGKPAFIQILQDGGLENVEGRFTIASAMEEFDMPLNLLGEVKDKSSWAREGLSVFNTVIEPGWTGFLTLELVFHGNKILHLPAGCGIAQVLFYEIVEPRPYDGKYQNQPDRPVKSIRK